MLNFHHLAGFPRSNHILAGCTRSKHICKGTQMGPLLVLVSPLFGGGGKCKYYMQNCVFFVPIGQHAYYLHQASSCFVDEDNFLLKNVTVFFLGNQISKWRSLKKKGGYFGPTFHILVTSLEKTQNIPSARILLPYTHTLLTLLTFFAFPILQIMHGFSLVRLLVLILFCAILEQAINNKMVSKI